MIIVSQNKRNIINFKQIKVIGTSNLDSRIVIAYFDNEDKSLLGTYATEERAMEVLKEIVIILNSDVKIYEMPKE